MTSLTKFEAELALLEATHNLLHAQGNAVAFTLKAELAKTDDERNDCAGCSFYWNRIAEQHGVTVRSLKNIINQHE